jgi:hypothetical protein
MEYTIKNVTTKEQLNKLYSNSAFTIEGLAEESIPDLIEWLKDNTTFTSDNLIVYVTSGKFMNENYLLSGDNAYPDELTIVSVIDIDLIKIALKRFSVGGRWFDDIVDNNARRIMEN